MPTPAAPGAPVASSGCARPRSASLLALSTLVAACGSTSGNPSAVEANTIGGSAPATTEHAGARPSATTDDRSTRPTATDDHRRADTTDRTTAGSAPGTSPADSDFTIKWGKANKGVQSGTIEVPSTTTTRRRARSRCTSSATWPRTRTSASARCWSTPAGPASAAPSSPSRPSFIYDQPLLDHFDILAWDPRGTGDEHAGHRLLRRLRPLLRQHRHHPGHRCGEAAEHRPRQGVDRRLRRRRTPTILQHVGDERLGARHGRHPPGARRGQDQLLRLQLRQRARGDVGDAVPRHGAGRGARRRRRPHARPRRVRARRRPRRSRPRSTRSSRSAAPTRSARSTTTATPRARSTR